ncbi:MAG: universal stress protein [Promethearchaeota archaeon]
MYRKILLGIDDSEDAVRAAKKAIELQKNYGSEVVAFHSVLHHFSEINPSLISISGGGSNIALTIHEDYIKKGEKILKDLNELYNQSDAKVETRLVYDIPPEDYIKKTVKKENFDLVILGCKGHHSKITRSIVGTVPLKVMNDTNSDVLIVR